MADETAENRDEKSAETTNENSRVAARRDSGLIGTILLVLFFVVIIGWLRFSTGVYKNEDGEVEPAAVEQTETPPVEQEKVEDSRDSQVNDALDDFLEANYKDWQKQGKSFDDAASDEDRLQIFDVQLANGNKNQVITVFVEKFQRDDDGEFWFAYQPDNRQLLESAFKTAAKKSSAADSPDKNDSGK